MNEPQPDNMRRLSIIDLILITTAVAFVFMLHGTVESNTDFSPPDWLWYPLLFVIAMKLGLVLPAIYWIPALYARTGKFFRHPGHWILGAQFVIAIWSVGSYIAYLLGQRFIADDVPNFYAISNLTGTGFHLAAMIFSIVAAILLKEIRWKISMILLAGSFAVEGFALAYQAISMNDSFGITLHEWQWVIDIFMYIAMAIASIGIIVAVFLDWTSKVSRDWLHWLGLISKLASLTVIPLLHFILVRYMMSQFE